MPSVFIEFKYVSFVDIPFLLYIYLQSLEKWDYGFCDCDSELQNWFGNIWLPVQLAGEALHNVVTVIKWQAHGYLLPFLTSSLQLEPDQSPSVFHSLKDEIKDIHQKTFKGSYVGKGIWKLWTWTEILYEIPILLKNEKEIYIILYSTRV